MNDDKVKQALGNQVRRFREARGITQEKLAELSNVDSRQIQRIETGNTDARITTVYKISEAFNCRIDDLTRIE